MARVTDFDYRHFAVLDAWLSVIDILGGGGGRRSGCRARSWGLGRRVRDSAEVIADEMVGGWGGGQRG
ncbi:hypothetical protein [Micromonospora sp. CPCC 206060]|uniref:hypothetical protein n=1 Tax=Micromonospora sp. CPCC 206060 TaxID=3122406 RepID=UPI002FF1665C